MSELIANLGLDWKLLLAQMFNFGILAFVLTKLVYKPLLKALKERQKIAKANEEAEKIVSQARAEAKAERALLFSEARRDMASLVIRAAEKVLEREVTKEDSKKLAQKAIEELT